MDRNWFPGRRCKRDDTLGYWPCQPLAAGPPATPPLPASTTFATSTDPRAAKVAPSLVVVGFDMPYSVSGVTERNYHGTGVVVDAARGLVVVDRNTVPVGMGDVRITFGGTVEVPGKVVYVHPLHNLAVVAYDPKLIGTTPVKSARFSQRPMLAGDDVWVVGLRADHSIRSQQTRVASVDPVQFPPSRTLQFRENDLEVVSLVNGPGDYDGVLADKDGAIVGLWSSFAFENGRDLAQQNFGVPADVVTELVDLARSGQPVYSLEADLQPVPLSVARKFGLTDAWIQRFEKHTSGDRQLLGIGRAVGGSPAEKLLEAGDLLLTIDGQIVNRFREVERAVRKPKVQVVVWRNGAELTLDVATVQLDGNDVDRVVMWAGATLQAPHRAMAVQRGVAPDGVFVAYFLYGSPATRYGLFAGRRIVEVDGRPTPDLDAFLAAVSGKPDRASLRLKTITWNNAVEVITLKLDKHYWPAYELRRTPGGWVRTALDPS
jgi:S1-C subfamily serine protease